MKTAAVVLDAWKLPVFEKHLKEAGYTYQQGPGITKGTLTLHVAYEWVASLKPVIEAAQKECAAITNKGAAPAGDCEICAGTGTAFGKTCDCKKGASHG